MSTKKKLENYMKASFPGLGIQTSEEARAIAEIKAAAIDQSKGVYTWSATEGLRAFLPVPREIGETEDLVSAAKIIAVPDQKNERGYNESVFIFRDIHTWPFDRDPILARAFRDLLAWAPPHGSTVVCVGPELRPHGTFEKMMTIMEFSLPDATSLRAIAAGIAKSAGKPEMIISEEVVRALSGMSTTEAENALALSLIEVGVFAPAILYREKVQAVKKSGLLEIIDSDPRGMAGIGGLDILKDWTDQRKLAYTPEAEAFGLPAPKGVLLVGVPGTGKSLSAKAFGTVLGVPTIKLDIGSMFNSLVGESEQRMRDTLKLAEAMAPCVLWVDEIDKGLAGSSGSGSNDSGVTRRIFGTIISWMQERRRPVFLVATANQVEGLPPELLRKGRFDEIFAIDLPTLSEREAILRIQLEAKGRKDLPVGHRVIAQCMDKFTGSEIENVVNEALFRAFYRDPKGEVTESDLIAAANATVPLAVTAKEQIDGIREWAQKRARFASSTNKPEAVEATGRRLAAQA